MAKNWRRPAPTATPGRSASRNAVAKPPRSSARWPREAVPDQPDAGKGFGHDAGARVLGPADRRSDPHRRRTGVLPVHAGLHAGGEMIPVGEIVVTAAIAFLVVGTIGYVFAIYNGLI